MKHKTSKVTQDSNELKLHEQTNIENNVPKSKDEKADVLLLTLDSG